MKSMKLYEAYFKPMYPVPSCLIIAATDMQEAIKIAKETIRHTDEFEIREIWPTV